MRRFASWIGIVPEGVPFALSILLGGIALAAAGFRLLGIVLIVVGAAISAFFRDPQRRVVAGSEAVISGADGRVCDISPVSLTNSGSNELYIRISVFMSPLDVHVNRAPVSGGVIALTHARGQFRAAFRDAASEHNEQNSIKIRDDHGHDHVLVQVAGYLARRIVCYLSLRQRLERGQRIGLIMFGSRVDHFLPPQYRVAVQIGDRVRGGETIIGELTE